MGIPVLVVEDDRALSSMIAQVLDMDGYDITVVDDGRKALSALRSGEFVAVLLDVMLPGLDGISLLRAIREDPAMWSIPVVMITAKTDDMTTWEGWKAGCDYFLTKPFDPGELATILHRLRSGSSAKG
jgi:two-component system response regulator MtrA